MRKKVLFTLVLVLFLITVASSVQAFDQNEPDGVVIIYPWDDVWKLGDEVDYDEWTVSISPVYRYKFTEDDMDNWSYTCEQGTTWNFSGSFAPVQALFGLKAALGLSFSSNDSFTLGGPSEPVGYQVTVWKSEIHGYTEWEAERWRYWWTPLPWQENPELVSTTTVTRNHVFTEFHVTYEPIPDWEESESSYE